MLTLPLFSPTLTHTLLQLSLCLSHLLTPFHNIFSHLSSYINMTDHEGLGTNTQSFTQLTALQDDGQWSEVHEQRDAPVENYDRQVVFGEACFGLVQDYRGGRRTKADTVQRCYAQVLSVVEVGSL